MYSEGGKIYNMVTVHFSILLYYKYNIMNRVIISSDNNINYINFWKVVVSVWKMNTDFIPTLFFIGIEKDFKLLM